MRNKNYQVDPRRAERISKFLSLVLRHKPERIGIELDDAGWVPVRDLLESCAAHGMPISREELHTVVATNDKQRFAYSDDGKRIRANQGHSVEVELDHAPAEPQELLYHGTAANAVETIRREGLKKMRRHHVHLSENLETTMAVGARRGRPVLVTIRAGEMHRDGHVFFKTPNNVWLVDEVPAKYLEFPDHA
jgi:putative RNA 2'-phosphotransferase